MTIAGLWCPLGHDAGTREQSPDSKNNPYIFKTEPFTCYWPSLTKPERLRKKGGDTNGIKMPKNYAARWLHRCIHLSYSFTVVFRECLTYRAVRGAIFGETVTRGRMRRQSVCQSKAKKCNVQSYEAARAEGPQPKSSAGVASVYLIDAACFNILGGL